MKYINFGGRYELGKNLAFFGLDEINAELVNGGRITKLIPQGAIVTTDGKEEDGEKLWVLSGFTIIAEIEEPSDVATHS